MRYELRYKGEKFLVGKSALLKSVKTRGEYMFRFGAIRKSDGVRLIINLRLFTLPKDSTLSPEKRLLHITVADMVMRTIKTFMTEAEEGKIPFLPLDTVITLGGANPICSTSKDYIEVIFSEA